MSDKDALQAGVHKVEHDGSISNSFNDSANDLWKQLGSSSKIGIMERDEEGFMDCATYHDRIYIQDLQPCMLNITILGRVIAVANNASVMRLISFFFWLTLATL